MENIFQKKGEGRGEGERGGGGGGEGEVGGEGRGGERLFVWGIIFFILIVCSVLVVMNIFRGMKKLVCYVLLCVWVGGCACMSVCVYVAKCSFSCHDFGSVKKNSKSSIKQLTPPPKQQQQQSLSEDRPSISVVI